MKRLNLSLGVQIATLVVFSLILVWSVAFYELYRSHEASLREAKLRATTEAQVFAEYSRSTLKRINEFILNIRPHWNGDWEAFSALVKRSQENIDDISFQVAVIDKDGLMAFSNLSKPNDRTDLSHREHFLVHKKAEGIDRLFISKPLLGKVSGKWSIQVTRPILRGGKFEGVVVVSLSPDQFASFAEKLRITPSSALTVVRSTGEIMARYPSLEKALGIVLKDRPFLEENSPVAGNFRQISATDGTDRIWGFYRLPEYGMSFVMGEAVDDVLAPFRSNRATILLGAAGVSILAIVLFGLLFRSLASREEIKRQLAEIFSLSPDGFVSFDNRRCVRYASPAFNRLTGLDGGRIAGVDETAFADQLAGVCASHACFPSMTTLRSRLMSETTHPAAEGGNSGRFLIEIAYPNYHVLEVGLRLSHAEKVSQILYFRDVTHETEVDRMKSEFLSTAAHELRTPMASIYGFAELLLQQEFDEDMRRDLLETIYRQSEVMATIINELLDLARIEARRGKDFVLEDVLLSELASEAAMGYKIPADREPPVIEPPKQLPLVRADRKKLQQVIVNLISNAYKYSPNGGEVSIRFVDQGLIDTGMIGIRVRDQGIGMTPEQSARIFERFYRADTSGKIPGSGLGMSIVQEIVNLHHGRIDVDSSLGQGTSVTVWLPTVTA